MPTFASVTGASKEATKVILDWIPYIHYSVQFHKDKEIISALINSGSEFNVMTLAYAKKLGLRIQKIDIGAEKIDGSSLDMFRIVIASFLILDKQNRIWFFQKTFLLTNTTIEVVPRILFLTFSNANIQFAEKKPTWRFYTTKKALSSTQKIELINKEKLAKAALNENIEVFMVYISFLSLGSKITIYLARET